MTVPPPRETSAHTPPQESPAADEVTRDEFLATLAALYDRLREGSRAQIAHAVMMCNRELGGTLMLQLPSRQAKRPRPEAAYVSEMPEGLKTR